MSRPLAVGMKQPRWFAASVSFDHCASHIFEFPHFGARWLARRIVLRRWDVGVALARWERVRLERAQRRFPGRIQIVRSCGAGSAELSSALGHGLVSSPFRRFAGPRISFLPVPMGRRLIGRRGLCCSFVVVACAWRDVGDCDMAAELDGIG
jgi:hypothetical protein